MESSSSFAYVPDSSSNGNAINASGVSELNCSVNTTTDMGGEVGTPSTVVATPEPERRRPARTMIQSKLAEMLRPRDATSVLNELLRSNMPRYTISQEHRLTKATIVINGNRYEAIARNKKLAKASAADQVLRDICVQQLAIKTDQTDTTGEQIVEVEPNSSAALLMAPIASYAVQKLLEQWKHMHQVGSNTMPTNSYPSAVGTNLRVQLPPNPTSFPPCSLLMYMVPEASFQDDNQSRALPTEGFTVQLKVGKMSFFGTAQSKKKARKVAAIDACKTLFGVDFDA